MNTLLINLGGLFGEGLKSLIKQHNYETAFGDAKGLDQARTKIFADNYDLAIFDLDSVVPNKALDMIKTLATERSRTPFVVLSSSECPDLAELVLEYGAGAYLPKSKTRDDLLTAIQSLLPAEYFSSTSAKVCKCEREDYPESLLNASRITAEALTPRQLDVLKELAKGKSNKHIAQQLQVSENTVRNHLSAVFRVLRARNRTEALCHATKLNIIPELLTQSAPVEETEHRWFENSPVKNSD